jgi:phosphatidylglycerophosphate synthase
MRIIKSTYYSNWGDLFGYKIAAFFVPFLARIPFITPNFVTVTAFISFALGCVFQLGSYSLGLLGGIMVFAGYIGDDIDGQLARVTRKYSTLGDYLDKVLDVLKIFFVTFFPGLGVFIKTGDALYLILAFIACFFFMYRYYIKLESMFSAYSRDEKYFQKSSEVRAEREKYMDHLYSKKGASLGESLHILWIKNRTFFFFDEAEFAILLAIFAILGKVDVYLWIAAIAQVSIAVFRVFERGNQLQSNSSKLLEPMRK